MKKCIVCKKHKPLEDFGIDKSFRSGLKSACKKCINERKRNYYKKDKRSNKNVALKKNFGITIDEFEEMEKKQGGVCASCGNPETKRKGTLCVDHNHETGEIRGLLCTRCNIALGLLHESRKSVIGLRQYMIKYNIG